MPRPRKNTQTMPHITPTAETALRHLLTLRSADKPGSSLDGINNAVRGKMLAYGWVAYNDGLYTITEAGIAALNVLPVAITKSGETTGRPLNGAASQPPADVPCNEATACLTCEVMELLRSRVPEVAALYDAERRDLENHIAAALSSITNLKGEK